VRCLVLHSPNGTLLAGGQIRAVENVVPKIPDRGAALFLLARQYAHLATHPGTVQKVIKPVFPGEPEKAEIALDDADHLYREIRIENALTDPAGKEVALKPGAQVDVTISAEPNDTVEKSDKR